MGRVRVVLGLMVAVAVEGQPSAEAVDFQGVAGLEHPESEAAALVAMV